MASLGDAAAGEADFGRCKACHAIVNGEETIVRGGRSGPNLFGMIGSPAAAAEGFRYGKDMIAAGEAGLVWDEANFAEYITDPTAFLRTFLDDSSARAKMSYKHRSNPEDVTAYISSLSAE
ncbi:MAG: cytochrome C [Rhodobacteraceae bacterium]|nr:cytochrome C [Paracoccaceae bacterium]